MAGLFDLLSFGQEAPGGGLLGRINNPLTLAGLGVLSAQNGGDAWQQGMQGFAFGSKAQQDAMKQAQLRQAMQQYAGGGDIKPLLLSGDPQLMQLALQLQSQKRQSERDNVTDDRAERELKLKERALNQREPTDLERRATAAGLQPGTPQFQEFMLRGGKNADVAPSITEKKEIFKSEDAVPALNATIANIKRAKELNPQVYSGFGASTRGALGAKLPDWMVPDSIASPQRGEATSEWDQLMGGEAIKNMSETLKGASTDFEMKKFLSIAADTSQPPKVRERAMDRFLSLAEEEKEIRTRRTKELRTGDYFKSPGSAAPAAQGDALAKARQAIQAGAPRDKVIERLKQAGVDPSGL